MLKVTCNGKDYDLADVAEAVAWAYSKADAEDNANAYKNCNEEVKSSPLTQQLGDALNLLANMSPDVPESLAT